jgi:hypothetical protein
MSEIPEKNIEIDGKTIGTSSTVKLSIKTALWLISSVFAIVMIILSYSYFDLKSDVSQAQKEFIEKVDNRVEDMKEDITDIKLDQVEIKGDIKLILDRQTRDNPVTTNPNVSVQPVSPPSVILDTASRGN